MLCLTLQDLAKALKGTVNSGWINVRAPGHGSEDRSVGFRYDSTAPDGIIINSFSGDDPELCRAHILALLAKIAGGANITVEPNLGDHTTKTQSVAYAVALFNDAEPIKGTLAETYLKSRQIELACSVVSANALRFHPQTPFGKGFHTPALLALMTHVLTGEPTGIQRIALADDGCGKGTLPDGGSTKRMLGTAHRSAVVLEPMGTEIAIAEGLETALSARQIFGVPVVAALSAGGVAHFPLVLGVKQLTIFADNDTAGLKAAQSCRERYEHAGIHVKIRYPENQGNDWNDHLITVAS